MKCKSVVWLASLTSLSVGANAQVRDEFIGNVRVQVLSETLVRLEHKGPVGFEDRPTFHIKGRNWPGAKYSRTTLDGRVIIRTSKWVLSLPENPVSLSEARFLSSKGTLLLDYKGDAPNSIWLPSPAEVPPVWVVADSPRLVPPPWGLALPPNGAAETPTNGWDVGNDAADIYVFLPGGDYQTLRADFLRLTGRTEMPPLYAFGFMDSKYYVYTEKSALDTIDEFRHRGIPLDTFVIDTDWRIGASHGYAPDPNCFPDMPRFLKAAHDRNVKIMFNDHPEPQAKTALDPTELRYRSEGLTTLLKQGVDVWWYDRNWHIGLVQPAPNLRREVWGMQLYRDITLAAFPKRRPLIMANVDGIDNGLRKRPPNIAAHRFPIQWTGDTHSTWDFLRLGVENAVFSGIRGLNPYVHEDLGGHAGSPSPELYIRFMQYGALSPVMRAHCTKGQEREPWLYGEEALRIATEYIKLRYRIIPLLYTAAHEAFQSGLPILRRLDLYYPKFSESARNDQYLLGDSILVAPVVTSSSSAGVVPPSVLKSPAGNKGLQAEYFANTSLTGPPILTRTDPTINFNWSQGSPDPKIPADRFSVRWTGQIGPIPGPHLRKLSFITDDGIRIWLDGKLAVDRWVDQASEVSYASVNLQPGRTYDVQIEYYENRGNAECVMQWEQITSLRPVTRRVWIPPGEWTDVWSGRRILGPRTTSVSAPIYKTPMFAKAGAIISLAPEMQFTGERPWDPLTLEIWPPTRGTSSCSVYEDDGASNDYLRGRFRTTSICVSSALRQHKVTVKIAPAVGSFPRNLTKRSYVLRIRRPAGFPTDHQPYAASVNGRPVPIVALAKAKSGMPFQGAGPAPDADLAEIKLPARSVSSPQAVEIVYKKKR